MDPISLLSELHGEGRVTVQCLREHGLDNLESLCAQEPRRLARILQLSEHSAKKMLAEARNMIQGKLFAGESRLIQPAKPLVAKKPAAPQPLSTDFKAQVVDLVAKRFS